jgi:orotidine-5'-phosphate decarboxylase
MTRTELSAQIFEKKTCLCVGLDPEISKMPDHLRDEPDAVFIFCREIIDATRPFCVAYKPNLAFFEALGTTGHQIFDKIVRHIGKQHLVIADAKRGDIGNTSRLYATAFFEKMPCDAITIAPYMGEDSVKPFLGFDGKWAIVLGLTSNPGSRDFQMERLADGSFLWEKTLETVAKWGNKNNLMFVVGATQTAHFQRVRQILPDHFLLVPGVGAQGGDLEETMRIGLNSDGGLLINATRSVIYASDGRDFAEAAAAEARRLSGEMRAFF